MSIGNFEQACTVLGVEIQASQAEIKSAYRELTKRLHPDNHPQQTERIREAYRLVQDAYEYTQQHAEEQEALLAERNRQMQAANSSAGGTSQSPQVKVLGSPVSVRTGRAERLRERKQFEEKARQEREARREKLQEDLQERKAKLDQEKKEQAILNEIRAIRLAAAIRAMLKDNGVE